MRLKLLRGIAIAGLAVTMLSSCGGTGSCAPNETLSLSLTAPNQYPAGIASTAYLTITNTSNVAANNLYYTIPAASNNTGIDNITVQNGVGEQPCITIPAHASCTFPAEISANSIPGSFKVIATPNGGNQSVSGKLKSVLGLQSTDSLELTANIGLTTLPTNEQIGANGITFLYSKVLPANENGSTPVDIVAVVNSKFASSCGLTGGLTAPEPRCPFNTINLTDQGGNLLDFRVLSANSGTGYSDLAQNAIVTFRLTIPQGTTNLSFYAQTMKDGTLVKQGDIANPIRLTTSPEGIVEVLPTYFKLSAVDNYTTQTVTYTNTGNAEVTNLKIQEPQSPIVISENNCPANLAVGSSCNVKVTSHAESGVAGTGSLVASYNGGIGSTDVISQYDYKGLNPIAGISLSATNNFAFAANTVFSSESTQVTLTNTGNVNESSFTFTFNPNYFTLATGSGLNPCNISSNTVTTTLGTGQSCTFTLTYTNALVGSGTSDITIAYKYQDYYGVPRDMSGNKSASYVTTQATASLNVAPNPKSFGTIIANSSDFKVESFTLTNNGVDTAESVSIGNSGVFSVQNSTCSQTLAPSASCTFDVKFGPTATESSSLTESLPITYKSVTDSSHLPVLLNLVVDGVARAPLSAIIEISSVSYPDSVGGDGEGSATPFQIESKDATSAIMTLTYKNVGTFRAESFTVLTESINMPAGYTLLANSCGSPAPINLAPNSTCDVTLKLATASTGSNNISFSTTVLPASWTDERGLQTNQAVSWNTGTSTSVLNTVYVNVFATPYITVTSSESSIGPGESTTFTFNLYGGYGVESQSLTTTNSDNTYIILESSPCTVSSSSSTCLSLARFTTDAESGSYVFTFSNTSGNVPLHPESFVVGVIYPTLYITPIKTLHPSDVFNLEITATPNSILTITLPNGFSSADGSTFTCVANPKCTKSITVGNNVTAGYYNISTSIGTQISIPIAVVKDMAYIPNSITSGLQVEICNFSGSSFSNCSNSNASIGSNKAYGVTVSAVGTYAYIATNSGVYKCLINQTSKSLDSCSSQSSLGSLETRLGAISTNGKYFYINSRSDGTIRMCQISSVDGSLSNCNTAKSGLTTPERLVLDYNGNNLFINTGSGTQSCSVNNSNGSISSCKSSGFASSATGISYNLENTRMYFTQVGNSSAIKFCNYNITNQSLSSCVDAFNGGSNGTSGWITGISFSSSAAFVSTVSDIYSCPINNTTGYLSTCTSASGSNSTSAEGITIFN